MVDRPEFPQRSLPVEPAPIRRIGKPNSRRFLQWSTVIAVALLLGIFLFLPRATFQIERVEYITTPCDPTSHSHQVTAAMSIRNTGTAAGVASVHLLVDGRIAETGHYMVPAHSNVQRGLSAVVTDCQSHRLAVELFTVDNQA